MSNDDDSDYLLVQDGTTLLEAEKLLVLRALRKSGWNKTAAAKALGISRRTIYNKLADWGYTTYAEIRPRE